MLVYCYYNMKLKLCDKLAEEHVANENDYIDLLHVASEPYEDVNDPLQDWIMPAHLDDHENNLDSRVAEGAIDEGVNVERVLSEEVIGDPNDDTASDDAFGGTTTPDSASNDDGDGGDGGNGGDRGYNYGQSQVGEGMIPFSCEQSFDHTTQDEDHGERLAGHGGSGKHDVKRRSARAPSNQDGQYDIDSITLSFDSISI